MTVHCAHKVYSVPKQTSTDRLTRKVDLNVKLGDQQL